MSETVVVLGASPKPERYSHRAVTLLQANGHHVIPVNPGQSFINELPVARSLSDITHAVDTVSIYVSPNLLERMMGDLIALAPKRVIFNPGSERNDLSSRLNDAGIANEEACTLVLLRTGQF
ncbi:MAG: CoA-binding protein [Moraxellaceae bacterium]|nr:CoA-binding protein [Moraxellaceae bacterium]MDP1775042.1 CoA-binding protein [Moraxellaceae bacterium]